MSARCYSDNNWNNTIQDLNYLNWESEIFLQKKGFTHASPSTATVIYKNYYADCVVYSYCANKKKEAAGTEMPPLAKG